MRRLSIIITAGIVIICIGFILSNCGTGPMVKVVDPDAGSCAVQFPFPSNNQERQYMATGHGESMSSSTEITVEAWIKTSSTYNLNLGTVFARGVRGGGLTQLIDTDGFLLAVSASSAEFLIANATGTLPFQSYTVTSTNTIVADSTWHHIAGVFSTSGHAHTVTSPTSTCSIAVMSAPHIDIYVDGNFINCNQVATTTLPLILDAWDPVNQGESVTPNSVGRDMGATTGGGLFSGIIDDIRLWKEARDKSVLLVNPGANLINTWKDIELNPVTNMSAANPNGTLIGYWPFNDCKGSTVSDHSGISNAGSLSMCNATSTCGSTSTIPGLKETSRVWETGWVSGHPFP